MLRIAFFFVVGPVLLIGWTQLSLALGGCNPPSSGEGEGEGEPAPEEVGGVTFSDTAIEADHVVNETDCPQDLGSFTLDNASGEERVVTFTLETPAVRMMDDGGNELQFVSLAVDQVFDVGVQFTCSQQTNVDVDIPATVTNADQTETLGTVQFNVVVNVDPN